ncbi:MAG: bacterial transcriptional activator domain-containing protein, partial [Actinomycetota bacterium]|nr:bacterial transcriptional activator domain-containing protein [Actinomycetota bacterium]
DPTYARAHEILAECASTSEARAELQRAFEHYRTAIGAWESCGEFARARSCRRSLAMGVLVPLGRYDEALAQLAQLLAAPDLHEAERSWILLYEGFVLANSGRLDGADECFRRCADIGLHQDNPRLSAAAAWGRALTSTNRGDLAETLRWIAAAESTAPEDDDVLGIPFLADASVMLGALGSFELAERYLARAVDGADVFPERVALAGFCLRSRLDAPGDVETQLAQTAPSEWWRVQLISAHAAARSGDFDTARRWSADADRELKALGFDDAAPLGERREQEALWSLLRSDQVPKPVGVVDGPAPPVVAKGRRRLVVIGSPMAMVGAGAAEPIPPGNPQRLVGVVVAQGGTASFDQLSEAIWPGADVEASRARLRNVLLRLRKVAGDVVMRSGNGVRLSPEVDCDLLEFEVLAADAMASLRADPDLAGRLASRALEIGAGTAFPDFEYEEWAIGARHATDQRMIALLDVLSVQAEDAGDLPAAQALAERALRLDRYTDSRYVRLAELLVVQNRNAAAVAVLQDAAAVARELGAGSPTDGSAVRRDELLKNAASDR